MLFVTPSPLSHLTIIGALYWQIASRFLKPTKKTIDLVGNEKMKASTNVRHIVLPCFNSAIPQLIPDVIRCYSRLVVSCSSLFICNILNSFPFIENSFFNLFLLLV